MEPIKVSDATQLQLAWLVATCEGFKYIHIGTPWQNKHGAYGVGQVMVSNKKGCLYDFNPAINWSQGGPILEREGLYLKARNDAKEWKAGALSMNRPDNRPGPLYNGHTPLIAAMRCYVTNKLSAEVEVPEELSTTKRRML